jgi:Ca2+-binding RTX toxin-like protein
MTLPKAIRTLGKTRKRRVLGLATLILAVAAGSALAATITGNGTLVGSPGNDTISTKGGNDVIYGEAGSDTITLNGTQGNNMVDGDGSCQNGQGQNLPPGVYPNPLTGSAVCEHGNQDAPGQQDTISENPESMANDIVMGGASSNVVTLANGDDQVYMPAKEFGNNTITVGAGNDTIDGGPNADTIFAGSGNDIVNGGGGNDKITVQNGNDRIYLGSGKNTVTTGTGSDIVYAYQSGDTTNVDTITCGSVNTKVYANKQDVTSKKCQRIPGAPAADPSATTHRTRATKASRKHHGARHHKTSHHETT